MKARYIGGEGEAGSRETILFGIKVQCGGMFDVPAGFEHKARLNPWVEVVEDVIPAASAEEPLAAPKTRKRKEKDNDEPIA